MAEITGPGGQGAPVEGPKGPEAIGPPTHKGAGKISDDVFQKASEMSLESLREKAKNEGGEWEAAYNKLDGQIRKGLEDFIMQQSLALLKKMESEQKRIYRENR